MSETRLTRAELASVVEHAVLSPTASRDDIVHACSLARSCGVRALVVAPCWLKLAANKLEGSPVMPIAAVGFPYGYGLSEAKAYEARRLVEMGAQGIEMVMDLSLFKSGDYAGVAHDIAGVATLVELEGAKVSVIIETGSLDALEIETACSIVRDSGAYSVKTSTGVGRNSAVTADAVAHVKMAVGDDMKINAAGGIRSLSQVLDMIASGADIIGTSATEKIFSEL